MYFNFTDIIIDHYYTNKKDLELAEEITSMIEDYETKTGNEITKVAFYLNSTKSQYKDTRLMGDGNVRAFFTEWGAKGILELTLNRKLDSVTKEPEVDQKFKNEKWKDYEFNENQVLFQDEILHLCIK